MLLSDIGEKEIVDLTKGSRHGKFWDAELVFNEDDGSVTALQIPNYHSKNKKKTYGDDMQIPWNSIVKIGQDIIIIRT